MLYVYRLPIGKVAHIIWVILSSLHPTPLFLPRTEEMKDELSSPLTYQLFELKYCTQFIIYSIGKNYNLHDYIFTRQKGKIPT